MTKTHSQDPSPGRPPASKMSEKELWGGGVCCLPLASLPRSLREHPPPLQGPNPVPVLLSGDHWATFSLQGVDGECGAGVALGRGAS